jgi:2-octaprenyl-6-methoxyphenol hydroxylase
MTDFQVAVAGGGLAGSIAALAFARSGFNTVLIAPDDQRTDRRTTALMDQSLGFLKTLGLWDAIRPYAAALATMQIIDGTERLLRAPTVAFRAAEIGLDAFGYNILNAPMLAILTAAIDAQDNLTRIRASVARAEIGDQTARLVLDDGQALDVGLVVGADGRNSLIRQAAGIDTRKTLYPQTALVLNFGHQFPHNNISTEFHTPTGPFTQVPLGENRSSLVWVVRPEEAANLIDMTKEALNRRIETRMQSMLGKVEIEDGMQAWPLSAMTARRFGKGSAILIGEAAHVFPPIGAQGLNLSLRDIQAATELALKASERGGPLAIGEAYDRARRVDVISRTASIDLLNRSLLSTFLPVQMLRTAGLQVLASLAPLRHLVMQEGVAPGRGLRGFPEFLRKKVERQSA